jgi:branched-chain amino acid transport system substrate-binding protein
MKKQVAIGIGILAVFVVGAVVWRKNTGPAPGPAKREMIVASIIPLTGPAGEFGGYNREATELFVENYNRENPNGPKLRHVFQDSKSTPKDGASAAQAILLGERPLAMQVQLSGVAMAVAPIAVEKNILLFSIAGTGGAKPVHKWAFRNYPSPETTAEETAGVFLAGKQDAKVAIFRSNDEFGLSVSSAFRRRLKQVNVPLVAEETFENTATDFRAAATKVLATQPNAVYLIGFGNPLGRIIVQLRELGYKGDILGGPEIAFGAVLDVAKEAADGVKYLDLAFSAESQEEPTKSFVAKYEAKFGRKPTAVSAVVYDGWSLILEAVNRAGSVDTEKVGQELLKVASFRGRCGELRISEQRDVIYPLAPRTIAGGKPTAL